MENYSKCKIMNSHHGMHANLRRRSIWHWPHGTTQQSAASPPHTESMFYVNRSTITRKLKDLVEPCEKPPLNPKFAEFISLIEWGNPIKFDVFDDPFTKSGLHFALHGVLPCPPFRSLRQTPRYSRRWRNSSSNPLLFHQSHAAAVRGGHFTNAAAGEEVIWFINWGALHRYHQANFEQRWENCERRGSERGTSGGDVCGGRREAAELVVEAAE